MLGENLLFPPQHKLELPPSMERARGKGQSFSTALGERGVRSVWGEYQPHEHMWTCSKPDTFLIAELLWRLIIWLLLLQTFLALFRLSSPTTG